MIFSNNSEEHNMKGSEDNKGKLRIAVFGHKQVGKSALTVRYLTKRFIGEYKSNIDMVYHQTLPLPHHSTPLNIEIMDISCLENSPLTSSPSSKCDGLILVYSITDRSSFEFASDALAKLSLTPNLPPLILIANKNDLEHLRAVEKIEGLSLAMDFGCHFYELSVADNSPEVSLCFSTIVNQLAKPKRRFSVSKILCRLSKMSLAHKNSSSSDTSSSSGSESSFELTPPNSSNLIAKNRLTKNIVMDFSHPPHLPCKKTINCS